MGEHREHDSEYMRLVRLNGQLIAALEEVRAQMAALMPITSSTDYRIALRPDERGADPFDIKTLMDDIVVVKPAMFRAEQMTPANWWVACYLDEHTHDEITWSVSARSRPLRIEWVTTEFPNDAVYEHEVKRAEA